MQRAAFHGADDQGPGEPSAGSGRLGEIEVSSTAPRQFPELLDLRFVRGPEPLPGDPSGVVDSAKNDEAADLESAANRWASSSREATDATPPGHG